MSFVKVCWSHPANLKIDRKFTEKGAMKLENDQLYR